MITKYGYESDDVVWIICDDDDNDDDDCESKSLLQRLKWLSRRPNRPLPIAATISSSSSTPPSSSSS